MASSLRMQLALFCLLGVFLIPVATTSLRGLTHVVTCAEPSRSPFSVEVPDDGPPTLTSSTVIRRGDDGTVCGGLRLRLEAGVGADDRPGARAIELRVVISNAGQHAWRGSVRLTVDGVVRTVRIDGIRPGRTAADRVPVNVRPGRHGLSGDLLIGP